MYVNDAQSNVDVAQDFKLRGPAQVYSVRLTQLDLQSVGKVQTTRLVERILAHFPDMRAHQEGRNVLVLFHKDVALAIRRAFEEDGDEESPSRQRCQNC